MAAAFPQSPLRWLLLRLLALCLSLPITRALTPVRWDFPPLPGLARFRGLDLNIPYTASSVYSLLCVQSGEGVSDTAPRCQPTKHPRWRRRSGMFPSGQWHSCVSSRHFRFHLVRRLNRPSMGSATSTFASGSPVSP